MKYRLLRPLWVPTNAGAIRRVRAGQDVPFSERGMVDLPAGQVTDQLPPSSVGWMLRKGWIESVAEPDGGES